MRKESLPIPLFDEIRQQRASERNLEAAIELIPKLQEQLANFVRDHAGIPRFEGFDGLRSDQTGIKDSPARNRVLQDWVFNDNNTQTFFIDKIGDNKLAENYRKHLPKPLKKINKRQELRAESSLVVSPTILQAEVPDRATGPIKVIVSSSGYPYGDGDDKSGIIYKIHVEGTEGDIEVLREGVDKVNYQTIWGTDFFDMSPPERRNILERFGSREIRGVMNLVDRLCQDDVLITSKKRHLQADRPLFRFGTRLKFVNQEELQSLVNA